MTEEREKKITEIRNECAEVLTPGIVFAVEDGWLSLIHTTLNAIERILSQHSFLGRARVVQIKEKFGELRIYTRAVDGNEFPEALGDDLGKLNNTISQMSVVTCERCGDEAETRNLGGYYQTLCDKHAEQRQAWVDAGRPGKPWEFGV